MQLFFRYPSFRHKALTFSYDDGVYQDRRLIDILRAHGMRGTFNLNSGLTGKNPGWLMTKEECLDLYKESDTEVAMHAYTHPWLDQQPENVVTYEILRDRVELEGMFRRSVCGFAYPFGTYNDTVIRALRGAGAKYARTVESTHAFGLPTDWLRLHPTCHHKDASLFELADRYLGWEENTRRPGGSPMSMFYVWGHSYEFDTDRNWDVIERFAEKMADKKDIWYATNMELYRYAEAVSRVEISPDGGICYNPSAVDIYFYKGGKPYVVHAGEELCL
ncbi:MAG: polysaccharide deacetylase family protein [Clostridia bacterium]|nr:polysaccharide deacetylase family protein [Clostridia bacterium]